MNTMRIIAGAALAAAAAITAGCVSAPGQIVDKSKPMEQGRYSVVAESASSSVYNISIFWIPLPPIFSDSNSASEMASNVVASDQGRLLYRKALAKAPGADALIEYSLDTQYGIFPLPPFVVVGRTTLTGTPVKTTK